MVAADAAEKVPTPHERHAVCAVAFVYVPAGQLAHLGWPSRAEYVPAAQGVHAVAAPADENVPAWHCWQLPLPVEKNPIAHG